MKISVKDLTEAIAAAHNAARIARLEEGTEEYRRDELLKAAKRLCEQFGIAKDDENFWSAVTSRSLTPIAVSVGQIVEELVDDRDNQRSSLAQVFRLCGYRPPEDAEEVVRGLVVSIHTALTLSIDVQAPSEAAAVSRARSAFTRFADVFCAAEARLRTPWVATATKAAKKSALDKLRALVAAGAGAAAVLLASHTLPPLVDRLPTEAKAYACAKKEYVSEKYRPAFEEAFCKLPNSVASAASCGLVPLDNEIQALEAERDRLAKLIAETKKQSAELIAANEHLEKVDQQIEALRARAAEKYRRLTDDKPPSSKS